MLISVKGAGENELEPDQESMGDISVLSHFAKKSMTKTDRCTGALS